LRVPVTRSNVGLVFGSSRSGSSAELVGEELRHPGEIVGGESEGEAPLGGVEANRSSALVLMSASDQPA
jgi:hypothetical protein